MARKLGFSARPIIHDFANKMSRKVFVDSRLINSLATFSIFFRTPRHSMAWAPQSSVIPAARSLVVPAPSFDKGGK